MYGLPQSFDASVFVSRTLEQICFAAHQLYLSFGSGLLVTVESAFSRQPVGSAREPDIVEVPVGSSDLMGLLEHTVVAAHAKQDGTLALTFDNGEIFTIYDNSEHYESYRIVIGTNEIIV